MTTPAEYQRDRYRHLKAAGTCTRCAKKPAQNGVRCEDCRVRGNQAAKARKESKRSPAAGTGFEA